MKPRSLDIEFKIRKYTDEIPKNSVGAHPYERIFKAVTEAPRDQPVSPLECKTEEDAARLAQRLSSYFKGSVIVRKPKGSRFVYVAPKGSIAPRSTVVKVPSKLAVRRKKTARKRR